MNHSKLYLLFGILLAVIVSTANTCESSSGSSGGNSEPKYTTYEFNQIKLSYDLKSKEDSFLSLSADLGELALAHGVDGTKKSGAITNLQEILRNEAQYPDARKPEIKITIQPQAEDPVIHFCSQSDVGDNYVQNIPDYGANVNSMVVSIKSITTKAHKVQLCWSKTFDLNQQWWDNYSGKDLSMAANVTVGAYTKCSSNNHTALLRSTGDGEEYEVLDIDEDVCLEEEIDECEVDPIPVEEVLLSPTLDRPIYINGAFTTQYEWKRPIAVVILETEES